MTASFLRVIVLAFFLPCATAVSFVQAGRVTKENVVSSFAAQKTLVKTAASDHVLFLQEALRPTFAALPKNRQGKVSQVAARYVLHRMFAQQYGWFVRGLEPTSWNGTSLDSLVPANGSVPKNVHLSGTVKEWVPAYLEELMGGKSIDLQDLTVFAATVHDLINAEAGGRLSAAFAIQELSTRGTIDIEDVEDVLGSYYVAYLMGGNVSAASREEMDLKKAYFARKYVGWHMAEAFLRELKQKYSRDEAGPHSFSSVLKLVAKLGEEYHTLNTQECRALKSELRSLEVAKAGRVKLSTFYQKGQFGHWKFLEKADYLRTLGALDDSDPAQPQVITSNYIMSRPNCFEASDLYAVCCRNECEELMGSIEREIKKPAATAERIAMIITRLPSDTEEARRTLSAALLGRLQQVADRHGGKVPIHGRLFAQWMHHAYPRECPYPHPSGTTNPLTAEEWMQGTGQADSIVSPAEIEEQIKIEGCIGADGMFINCEESPELPWNDFEELLPVDQPEVLHTKHSLNNIFEQAGSHVEEVKFFLVEAAAVLIFSALVALAYRRNWMGRADLKATELLARDEFVKPQV